MVKERTHIGLQKVLYKQDRSEVNHNQPLPGRMVVEKAKGPWQRLRDLKTEMFISLLRCETMGCWLAG